MTVAPPFPAAPYALTNSIGIYQVTQRVYGQERQGAFAVNLFDPQQSRLAPANQLPVVHSINFAPGNNGVPRVLREVWPWIAALLLLILCLEWWLFSRGYRLQSTAATTASKGKGGYTRVGQTRSRNTPRFISEARDQLEKRYRVARKRLTTVTRRRKKGMYR